MMHTEQSPFDSAPPAADEFRPIVVGVDGSAHSRSALAWAADEADRSGRALRLVAASGEYVRAVPVYSAELDTFHDESHVAGVVNAIIAELSTTHPRVHVHPYVKSAEPSGLILEAAEDAEFAVVGKRGLGAFARVVVGSTSIAVAGRSAVPTVIVPDTWDQAHNDAKPILVGIDATHHDHASVGFAFQRAHELGVPVMAMYAWETHPALVLSGEDRQRWGDDAVREVQMLLAPWQAEFPDVRTEAVQRNAHPSFALLDASQRTQLVVLGRHTASRRVAGFAFGSVARAVLHYSLTPVAVVPEPSN